MIFKLREIEEIFKEVFYEDWNRFRCSNFHNRDFNAANNILDKGLELLFV